MQPPSSTPPAPPRRGALPALMVDGAARGVLELPVCDACGTVQYPLRERCHACLSPRLRVEPIAGDGTLLARTRLHHTAHDYFRATLPLAIGSIHLDAGPVVLAMLGDDCSHAGMRVWVSTMLDEAGQAVLHAQATNASLESFRPTADARSAAK